MQITPTGGAADGGASAAKIAPRDGAPQQPGARAGATTPLLTIPAATLADTAILSELAALLALCFNQNRMQTAPIGGAAGAGVSAVTLTPTTGQAGPVAATGGTSPSTTIQPAGLADSAVIRELALADLLKLTQILQPAGSPELTARVDHLVSEIVKAINEDRMGWAVGRFIEAATADPARVDELRSKPEFEPIRANVEHLMSRLTNVAKMDAETKLSSAEQLLEKGGWTKLPHWETAPEALVQIAHRLLEAGGYANYIRTAELATTLQSAYWGATVAQPQLTTNATDEVTTETKRFAGQGPRSATLALAKHSIAKLRETLPRRVEVLWLRVPLLILFGSWFALGLAGGLFSLVAKAIWPNSWIVPASDFGFQIWGVGFLALVLLGFWAQIRKPRR